LNLARAVADVVLTTGSIQRAEPDLDMSLLGRPDVVQQLQAFRDLVVKARDSCEENIEENREFRSISLEKCQTQGTNSPNTDNSSQIVPHVDLFDVLLISRLLHQDIIDKIHLEFPNVDLVPSNNSINQLSHLISLDHSTCNAIYSHLASLPPQLSLNFCRKHALRNQNIIIFSTTLVCQLFRHVILPLLNTIYKNTKLGTTTGTSQLWHRIKSDSNSEEFLTSCTDPSITNNYVIMPSDFIPTISLTAEEEFNIEQWIHFFQSSQISVSDGCIVQSISNSKNPTKSSTKNSLVEAKTQSNSPKITITTKPFEPFLPDTHCNIVNTAVEHLHRVQSYKCISIEAGPLSTRKLYFRGEYLDGADIEQYETGNVDDKSSINIPDYLLLSVYINEDTKDSDPANLTKLSSNMQNSFVSATSLVQYAVDSSPSMTEYTKNTSSLKSTVGPSGYGEYSDCIVALTTPFLDQNYVLQGIPFRPYPILPSYEEITSYFKAISTDGCICGSENRSLEEYWDGLEDGKVFLSQNSSLYDVFNSDQSNPYHLVKERVFNDIIKPYFEIHGVDCLEKFQSINLVEFIAYINQKQSKLVYIPANETSFDWSQVKYSDFERKSGWTMFFLKKKQSAS
jgi:hypothetical protein